MRIAFFGTPDFAVPTLDALVAAGHEVALVVAQPDRPAGRGQRLTPPPVAARAAALGLPLAQPVAIKTGVFPEQLEGLALDAAVVLAYGRILTRRLLDAPRLGCINVHGSLLPRWRGAAPIQAAILAGDTVTGVCTQQMAEGLDTGPVHLARELAIDPRETAGSLHDRLMVLAAEVAVATLDGLEGRVPVPQDDAQATWCTKISKDDGVVRWSDPADAIDRRVRAMTPWPGGQVDTGAGWLKLKAVHPVEAPPGAAPGTILSVDPLVVACGEGALALDTVQAAGRKPVSGRDFANGAHLSVGGVL